MASKKNNENSALKFILGVAQNSSKMKFLKIEKIKNKNWFFEFFFKI